MGEWRLRFDGLYEPRHAPRGRGVATYGFVAEHDGDVVHEEHGLVAPPGPLAGPHVAEFGALVQALAWLERHGTQGCPVVVQGDSRLAIETTAGRWRLTSERLLPLRDAARHLARRVGVARFEKIPRDDNAHADRLSRDAYHALAREHPEWRLRAARQAPHARDAAPRPPAPRAGPPEEVGFRDDATTRRQP